MFLKVRTLFFASLLAVFSVQGFADSVSVEQELANFQSELESLSICKLDKKLIVAKAIEVGVCGVKLPAVALLTSIPLGNLADSMTREAVEKTQNEKLSLRDLEMRILEESEASGIALSGCYDMFLTKPEFKIMSSADIKLSEATHQCLLAVEKVKMIKKEIEGRNLEIFLNDR